MPVFLVSSADGAGMDHPSMEVEADGNHHGYDVGMECHRIKQRITLKAQPHVPWVLNGTQNSGSPTKQLFFVKNKSCHSLQGEFKTTVEPHILSQTIRVDFQ